MAQSGGISKVLFVIYLVIALYLTNMSFGFITMPEFVMNFDKWVILLGAVLVFLGGINHLRVRKKTY